MESSTLTSVSTIMGMVHDILSAVETASQNKSRCNKVADRVRCINDILTTAAAAQDGTTSSTPATDATTRRLMDGLEEALSSALEVVRQCQRSSVLASVVCGGEQMADTLDGVERDIDRCILDLTLANSLRIARQPQHAVAATSSVSEKDDDNKGRSGERSVVVLPDDNTTATAAAIGVPVCTVTSSAVVHEMVPAPQSYGYFCSHCRSYHSYSSCDDYPSMFSDDDPNSCSTM